MGGAKQQKKTRNRRTRRRTTLFPSSTSNNNTTGSTARAAAGRTEEWRLLREGRKAPIARPGQMISFLISLSRRVQSDAFVSCGLKEAGQCSVHGAPGTTRRPCRAGRQRRGRDWNCISETYSLHSPFGPDHGR